MEKRIQVRVGDGRPHRGKEDIPHTRPPSSSLCQYAAIISAIEISAVTVNSSPIVMSASYNLLSGWKKLEKQNKSFKRKISCNAKNSFGDAASPLTSTNRILNRRIVERH
jgi:hypothetical protein